MKKNNKSDKSEWGPLKFCEGLNRGRYPYCHTLYWDGDEKILFDPCSDPAFIDSLAGSGEVGHVILTHYHEDHFGWLSKFPEAKVYIHGNDAGPIEDRSRFLHCYGIKPGSTNEEWLNSVLDNFYLYKERKVDVRLEDGMILDLGDAHIEVIHTPGHSPGHCCFYFREPDVLFLADFDLTPFGPWYGDRFSDLDTFIESSRKIRNHPAKWKVVSHDEGVLEGDLDEKWENYMAVINRRESDLLEFLGEPRTMPEIVDRRIVYMKPREPAGFYDFAEEATMMKHIERLMKQGTVVMEGDRYLRTD